MRIPHTLVSWLAWFPWYRRRQRDADLERELRDHLELETEERQAIGLSPREASRAAHLALGNTAKIEEDVRASWGFQWLETLLQDLRYGLRQLRRNPGFAAVALLSLALGIGANTAIFQLLDAVQFRLLPVSNPPQLAEVHLTNRHGRMGNFYNWHAMLTNAIWEKVETNHQPFSGVLAWAPDAFDLAPRGEVHLVHGMWVNGDFFDVLGVRPVLGRLFTPADDRYGCGSSAGVVVSYAFWQSELGGKLSAIGSKIIIDYHSLEVIGVTPPSFFGLDVGHSFAVALPICSQPVLGGEDNYLQSRSDWWLTVIGRLKPGWSLQKAAAYFDSISPGIMAATLPSGYDADHVKKYLAFKLSAYPAESGVSSFRGQAVDPLSLLLVITGIVLLIACANLANLMLARATARERETSVRLALGASRSKLVRSMLAESILLAVVGTAAGLALARVLSAFLVASFSTQRDALFLNLALDWRVFGFAAAIAILATVLFGLIPAVRAMHTAPIEAMKSDSRGVTTDRRRFGLQTVLVISQVGLCVILSVGAMLFTRSLHSLLTVNPGFRRSGILITNIDLTRLNLPAERIVAFERELLQRFRSVQGVEAAAQAFIVPTSGSSENRAIWPDGSDVSHALTPSFDWVTPGFFNTMGTPLLSGRDFNDRDTANSPKVAIVNEAFGKQFFGHGNPVGKRIWQKAALGEPQLNYEIVGVVGDTKYIDLRETFQPLVYLPVSQSRNADPVPTFLIRYHGPLADLTSRIKLALSQMSPDISVQFGTLQHMLQDELTGDRLVTFLSGFFGILAVLLAVVGLYGVMSYTVVRRTNEVGIRIALGAQRSDVLRLIVGHGLKVALLGVIVGVLGALALTRFVAGLLYGVKPNDPLTFVAVSLILCAVAFFACYIPARRAMRVDPVVALRYE